MEFEKLDLRVGLVKRVEGHPNADKLYKLTVDVGGKEITLLAGLKKYYRPEELEGREIIVVYNLEPKKMRGIVSQGMLLAADDGKSVGILRPLKKVPSGTRITI